MITDLRFIEKDGKRILQYLDDRQDICLPTRIWKEVEMVAREPELLKFEVGKYYRTISDDKVMIVSFEKSAPLFPYRLYSFSFDSSYTCTHRGTYAEHNRTPRDIVGPWEDKDGKVSGE